MIMFKSITIHGYIAMHWSGIFAKEPSVTVRNWAEILSAEG